MSRAASQRNGQPGEAGQGASTGRYVVPAVDKSKAIDRFVLDEACLDRAGAIFREQFGEAPALVVADENTWAAAGAAVSKALTAAGIVLETRVMPGRPRLVPDRRAGDEIAVLIRKLAERGAMPVPVAVGSGVVNDLVRYAAFESGTGFMSVPTAASMDGYTSAGAPLADRGFKITIQCVPPRVILADLDVIAAAPAAMSGWGFGDLCGKIPAGGDWLVADSLGIEALDPAVWPMVQDNLRTWLSDPEGVRRGDREAIGGLFTGLAVVGVAMELHGSSRPASGADHQIAHIWEMEDLSHAGEKVSHGACVAIGCLTMLSLFDWVIEQDLSTLDPPAVAASAPDWPAIEAAIGGAFSKSDIAARASAEMRGKWTTGEALVARLATLARTWPDLRGRLTSHLMREEEARALLSAAGAPVTVRSIGLTPERHRATVLKARWIRKRYTLLDMLDEAGMLERAVAECFDKGHPLYA